MKVAELLTEKTIITRRWEVFPVDVKRGIELLNKHCRASLVDIKSGNVLFRGFAQSPRHPVLVLNSSMSQRTSKDSDNSYQIAMDISEKFEGYPRRSNSFICTGTLDDAARYGGKDGTYAMIPYDGTPVAVARGRDVLSIFLPGDIDVSGFDGSLSSVFRRLGIKPDKAEKYTNVKRINAELAKHSPEAVLYAMMFFTLSKGIGDEIKAEERYDDKTSHGSIDGIMTGNPKKCDFQVAEEAVRASLKKEGKELLQKFQEAPGRKLNAIASMYMDPATMRISLQEPGSLNLRGEAWFSGECVAIKLPVFLKILEEFGKRASQSLVTRVKSEVEYS